MIYTSQQHNRLTAFLKRVSVAAPYCNLAEGFGEQSWPLPQNLHKGKLSKFMPPLVALRAGLASTFEIKQFCIPHSDWSTIECWNNQTRAYCITLWDLCAFSLRLILTRGKIILPGNSPFPFLDFPNQFPFLTPPYAPPSAILNWQRYGQSRICWN